MFVSNTCAVSGSLVSFLLFLAIVGEIAGFHIPGVAPIEFKSGEKIQVEAIKLTSIQTQLPIAYYILPFCPPQNYEFKIKYGNLGEILSGDRIVNTPYEVKVLKDIKCQLLCHSPESPITWEESMAKDVINKIEHEYFVHLALISFGSYFLFPMLVDNLPCVTRMEKQESDSVQYENGYRLGFLHNQNVALNNHLKFIFYYHSEDLKTYRIVRFEVEALSVPNEDISFKNDSCHFSDSAPQYIKREGKTKVFFTYSVEWKQSDVRWASRWDFYLAMNNVPIHWLSIVNSLIVVSFLSGILTIITNRTLRQDTMEKSGWKLVHGDVFRPPSYPKFFAAVIGSGIQIFCTVVITLFFAMLGILSSASKGALTTASIFLYVFMGLIAGYHSERLYKTIKGKEWKRAAFLLLSCILVPCPQRDFF